MAVLITSCNNKEMELKELLTKIDVSKQKSLITILENDPRPSYQNDPEREYGMLFASYEIFFKVAGDRLTVTRIKNI